MGEQTNKNSIPKIKVDPELTKFFVADARNRGLKGTYRIDILIGDRKILIDVFPEVFPPKSDYSITSRSIYQAFGDLNGLEVADIGCGSGIEAIVAVIAQAKHVDAVDINKTAVECSRHNISLNKMSGKISVFEGNLLDPLGNKKYDLIIANLPIVDFQPEVQSGITEALYDHNFEIHRNFLSKAKEHLNDGGIICLSHANLQSAKTDIPNKDFEIIENLVTDYGYGIKEKTVSEAFGYLWINYKIELKSKNS